MNTSPGKRTMHYHSFILTLWQEGETMPNAPTIWRYSLANPHTGERIGFRDAVELGRFLTQWVALLPPNTNADEITN
ncbi:MAG TPA: hypothetical protein PKV23_08090 [Aestuariivirga sp.]|nr:hypothetical protein [Aestuariivirga sp.]